MNRPSSSPTSSVASAVLRSRRLSPILLLALWEAASRTGLIPSHTLAAPSTVLATLLDMVRFGRIAVQPGRVLLARGVRPRHRHRAGRDLRSHRRAVAAGRARWSIRSMQIKRTIPLVALAPLAIGWFGIGETTKIALIAFAAMFPLYLNLYNGIRGVDKRLVEGALSFGLNRWQLIVHVILPGALPSLLVGLRYSLTISIVMLVIAEQINASAGLGFLINNARDFMRTDIIVVCLMVYALLGLAADNIVRIVETRALAWRPKLVEA
jgi:sulfonate transport system permease protein